MKQAPQNYSFSEIQRFTQSWLFYLVIAMALVPIVSTILVSNGTNIGQSEFMLSLAIGIVIGALVLSLMFFTKLEVYLEREGITYRLFPFQIKFKQISYNEIESYEIRKYSPILEYGGWGLRYSFKNGKAYNISGNMGIQLVLKNDKKTLFGTLKPEEFNLALSTMIKNKN